MAKILEHFYETIDGSFTYQNLYRKFVEQSAPDRNSHIVEIGCFRGRSTAFLLTEIINSGKPITLHVVDIFCGLENERHLSNSTLQKARIMEFERNIEPARKLAGNQFNLIVQDSSKAANLFNDGAIDFCFVDANHEYEFVLNDLRSWQHKIRVDGSLAGHDYWHPSFPGVAQAVHDFLSQTNLRWELNAHPEMLSFELIRK